jgi:hypothetical protein
VFALVAMFHQRLEHRPVRASGLSRPRCGVNGRLDCGELDLGYLPQAGVQVTVSSSSSLLVLLSDALTADVVGVEELVRLPMLTRPGRHDSASENRTESEVTGYAGMARGPGARGSR